MADNTQTADAAWELLGRASRFGAPAAFAVNVMQAIGKSSQRKNSLWHTVTGHQGRSLLLPITAVCIAMVTIFLGIGLPEGDDLATDTAMAYASMCDLDQLVAAAYTQAF